MSPDEQILVPHAVQLHAVVVEEVAAKLDSPGTHHFNVELRGSADGEAITDTEGVCRLVLDVRATSDNQTAFTITIKLRGQAVTELANVRPQLDRFLKAQGFALLLPFARELIANITTRMGLAPLLIPLVDVPRSVKSLSPREDAAATEDEDNGER